MELTDSVVAITTWKLKSALKIYCQWAQLVAAYPERKVKYLTSTYTNVDTVELFQFQSLMIYFTLFSRR